jgi:C4-dicarboxylate-specific signal transduction histidine kinase
VKVERQKALQIVTNLIANAKEAIEQADPATRQIRLALRLSPSGGVEIRVTDNGVGIAAENLTRVFAFGFTTKKNGHGFGLHSSANAAKEMGGSLRAESEGEGRGATFVLELPPAPPEQKLP